MKPVLCAGLVCLDQVTMVTTFPREDTDMRSLNQYKVSIATVTHSSLGLNPSSITGFRITRVTPFIKSIYVKRYHNFQCHLIHVSGPRR